MKSWQVKCAGRIARLVFSCSLLGAVVGAWASDYQALRARVEGISSAEDALSVLTEVREGGYPPALAEVAASLQKQNTTPGEVRFQLGQAIAVMEAVATENTVDAETSRSQIIRILSRPEFRQAEVRQESNWVARAGERISQLFRNTPPTAQAPVNMAAVSAPFWLTYVLFGILGVAAIAMLVVILRTVSFRRSLKRRVAALLEDDEPDRTLDEWLERAEELQREGRFREAVRCLYIACLLRCDEAGIARFVRSETNWEHLARIQRSSSRPAELDMRSATLVFDRVWYGRLVQGKSDWDEMRAQYEAVSRLVREKVAA